MGRDATALVDCPPHAITSRPSNPPHSAPASSLAGGWSAPCCALRTIVKANRVVAVAALLAACAFSASRPAPSPPAAEADRDAPDPPEVAVETPAQIEPDEALAWRVPSPVIELVVELEAQVGQRVKNGDPLATTGALDIVHPGSDLQRAEAEWIAAQHIFERQKELCEIDCVSRQFEAAEDDYRKARAKHERARDRAIHRSSPP